MLKILQTVFVLFTLSIRVSAQTDSEIADSIAYDAINLMDNGNSSEAIKLLRKAISLNPSDSIGYLYEIAIAYQLDENYKESIEILEFISNTDKTNDRVFQQLGNNYDLIKEPEKALLSYNRGLEKYPNSGCLYLEHGNIQAMNGRYNEALEYYEKGITVDPMYPTNYYRAAQIFFSSQEVVWGMMYGEIYIALLTSNKKRATEMSKSLFDTYQSGIKISSDTSVEVEFSKKNTVYAEDLAKEDFRLPFPIGAYGLIYATAAGLVMDTSYEGICKIREYALHSFFENDAYRVYDNVLFDYQRKVEKAGHLDAYNHYVILGGDREYFSVWYNDNKGKAESFFEWFVDNPLKIDKENAFVRKDFL